MKNQLNNKNNIMESKFKIGDEIFFMDYATPSKGIIKGICFVEGEFDNSSFKRKSEDGTFAISYSAGPYTTIDEEKSFATKEELKANLFKSL